METNQTRKTRNMTPKPQPRIAPTCSTCRLLPGGDCDISFVPGCKRYKPLCQVCDRILAAIKDDALAEDIANMNDKNFDGIMFLSMKGINAYRAALIERIKEE